MLCLAKLLWAEAFPGEPMLKCKDCTVSDKCECTGGEDKTKSEDKLSAEERGRVL